VAVWADSQDNQFHGVAKSDIQQSTDGITKSMGYGFRSVAEKAGERDDGNGIHGENDGGAQAGHELDKNSDGHEDEKDVKPAVAENLLGRLEESHHDIGSLLVLAVIVAIIIVVSTSAVLGGVSRGRGGLRLYDRPLPRILRVCRPR